MTDRPDAPAPMRRRGPRPLALHLALDDEIGRLRRRIAELERAALPVTRPLIRGIAAYRHHPYQPHLPDPPVIWARGQHPPARLRRRRADPPGGAEP